MASPPSYPATPIVAARRPTQGGDRAVARRVGTRRALLRRHRFGVTAGALVALALVVGLALAPIGFVRTRGDGAGHPEE